MPDKQRCNPAVVVDIIIIYILFMFIIIALCDVQRMRERVCVCESVLAAGRCLYDIIYENI